MKYFKRIAAGILASAIAITPSGSAFANSEAVTMSVTKDDESATTESQTTEASTQVTTETIIPTTEATEEVEKSEIVEEKPKDSKSDEAEESKKINVTKEDVEKKESNDIDMKKKSMQVDVKYRDKSLQMLYEYQATVKQKSLEAAIDDTKKYIENDAFDFYDFLCNISKNDPYEVFYRLPEASREKVFLKLNHRETYALRYILLYAGLDYFNQNHSADGKEFYQKSLKLYFSEFANMKNTTQLGEDVSDLDILIDHFFQMRKDNYEDHINGLQKKNSSTAIKEVSEILNDESNWDSVFKKIQGFKESDFEEKDFGGLKRALSAYKSGAVYLQITGNATSKQTIKLTRSSAPTWTAFESTAYSYKISTSGTNNHGISINGSTGDGSTNNGSTVKARWDGDAGYTILNFLVKYTQPAHWEKKAASYYKADCGSPDKAGRMNFEYYKADNSGSNSFSDGLVHSNTSRAINFQVNLMQCGLRDDASSHHHGSDTTYGATMQFERPSYYLDVNGNLDGSDSGGTSGYGTFDVYVNGVQKANDVTDFYQQISDGSTYEIKDVKSTTGRSYNGVYSGSASGTVCAAKSVSLKFTTNSYYLDVNGLLDEVEKGDTNGFGTFDVYVNGSLVADNVTDFYKAIKYGSSYEIKDVQDDEGYTYNGNPSYTGKIPANNVGVRLSFTTNSYDLTVDPNGGTYNGSSRKNTTSHKYKSQLSIAPSYKEGHTFLGYQKGNTVLPLGTNSYTSLTMGASDVTLTATYRIWEHNIVFKENCGDSEWAYIEPANRTGSKTYGSTYKIPGEIPLRINYVFKGWNTKADGSGTMYQPGDSYTHDQDGGTVNLYAQWKEVYRVQYGKGVEDKDNIMGNMSSQDAEVGDTIQLQNNGFVAPIVTSDQGDQSVQTKFAGWDMETSNSTRHAEQDAVTYEQLVKERDGVTTTVADTQSVKQSGFDVADNNLGLVKASISYTDENGNVHQITVDDKTQAITLDSSAPGNIASDHTFTVKAQWSYTIRYNGNEEYYSYCTITGSVASHGALYKGTENEATLKNNGFSNNHGKFTGWSRVPDGERMKVTVFEENEEVGLNNLLKDLKDSQN